MPDPSDSTPTLTALLDDVASAMGRSSLVELSDARFLATHDVFEAASSQRGQIARWFGRRWGARPPADLLSIGSGGGDLDLQILRALRRTGGARRYLGIDPNPVECARCRELLAELAVEVEVEAVAFEDARLQPASFDVAYAVHTLYYLGDVPAVLRACLALLRDGGELIVFQAPRGHLNRLSALPWEAQLGRSIAFSEDLRLDLQGVDHACVRIDAAIDVAPCLREPASAPAVALRDFILQVDSSLLDDACIEAVDVYLGAIATADGDRMLAPHPVDAFVIPCEVSPG